MREGAVAARSDNKKPTPEAQLRSFNDRFDPKQQKLIRSIRTAVRKRFPTANQAETDQYWNAIVGNGGKESACGWCKDKWGLSWQITPVALTNAITDPDPAAAKRAFDAMMEMTKIDIAAIEAARRG